MPPLGFIEPKDRTQTQHDAHNDAAQSMIMHGLTPMTLAPGQKIMLTEALKDPRVIADMGMQFPGFRQITGACVGVTEGEGTATLSALQRCIAINPTKAFIPWWLYPYGRTRFNEGDRGQGEGAVSSVMGKTLEIDGTFARDEVPTLPQWDTKDGLAVTKSIEMMWSDGGSNLVSQYLSLGRTHPFGARTPAYTTQDIVTLIANGYPVLNGCAYYIGTGHIKGTGDTAYVVGKYDGKGGHETGFYNVWNHPNDGLLFDYWNHWNGSTYPKDPAGGPRCSTWVPESEVSKMLNAGWNGIEKDECFGISHVNYFPAQVDRILDWSTI